MPPYALQADTAQKPFWHTPEPPMQVVEEGLNWQAEQQGVSPEHCACEVSWQGALEVGDPQHELVSSHASPGSTTPLPHTALKAAMQKGWMLLLLEVMLELTDVICEQSSDLEYFSLNWKAPLSLPSP